MATEVKYGYETDIVPCPGETLREVLEDQEMSQVELAMRLGRSEKFVSQLIGGKASLGTRAAIDLERVLGVPASFWLNSERMYREWLGKREDEALLGKSEEWLKRFPVKAMVKNGWMEAQPTPAGMVRELLEFLGAATPDTWDAYWRSPAVAAFRKSPAFDANPDSLAAWLRQGERLGHQCKCTAYNRRQFLVALRDVRAHTTRTPDEYVPAMIKACADAGVAVVLVKELPGIRCSAATRWLGQDRALIQLCLRYRTDDQLWFSFFHEAAHVVLHGKREAFIEWNGDSEEEREANRWAADFLVPVAEYGPFVEGRDFSRGSICAFAERVGVAPGVVVGRLQHERLLPWRTRLNDMKVHLEWAE